jgi:hypothetical protein
MLDEAITSLRLEVNCNIKCLSLVSRSHPAPDIKLFTYVYHSGLLNQMIGMVLYANILMQVNRMVLYGRNRVTVSTACVFALEFCHVYMLLVDDVAPH